ncbi:MAG: exodeoxyribonuclease III [Kiloniellales bacterium]|nr:exodeoxyribonuclease III [Kiloniellales bacterium]
MPLRLATWNVNSIRQRVEHLKRFLTEEAPDAICLQETKVEDDQFPTAVFDELGYAHRVIHGQKSYNGVAIASRLPFEDQGTRIWCRKDDKRHAFVRLPGGIELHNFYVPSGGDKPDPEINDKFDHKLRFLRAMARWCRSDDVKSRRLVLVGDLNVAPLETDVWNHKRLVRSVGHTPVESDLMRKLWKAGGLIDVPRHFVPPSEPLYSWWGYRFPQAFQKDYGWRLDHVLVTEPLMPEVAGMQVVKHTRTWEKPSDHVPVVVDLA